MSQTASAVDETLDLFDVHGESPSPALALKNDIKSSPHIENEGVEQTNILNPSSEPSSTSILDIDVKTVESIPTQSPVSLIPKATALNKMPQQMNNLQSITLKPSPNTISKMKLSATESPLSSNASSPIPPINNKNLAVTLDKFSKEDLFKLFGKARKENRVMKMELESLKVKNRDIYKALNAYNEQNEVLQITNQHLREEYNALKSKSSTLNNELRCVKRENEETISLIKTQCASYMDEVNRLNEQIKILSAENTSVQSKIHSLENEINMYREQIGKYKEIVRNAEANLNRIESLEEELRDKIRDNHALQIKTRSLQQTIKRMNETTDKQNEKIQELQTEEAQRRNEVKQLKTDHTSYKEHNTLLNDKLNILLKENANNTLRTEKKIESIENYHLSKYKTLLNSFQMMKKRIEENNRMNELELEDSSKCDNSGYSNAGWKRDHKDYRHFNFEKKTKHLTYAIDLEMDEDLFIDNIKDLNHNINALSTHSGSYDSLHSNQIKIYENQIKEYKHIICSLQNKCSKKYESHNKRINIDYLRNVLVKFLILTEYLTDEQIVLVPVLGSILNLNQTEKDMIDNSYNTNRYFMGTNTLFPSTANAKYRPQKRKKRKKKKERQKNMNI